jgi:hypothetical protein
MSSGSSSQGSSRHSAGLLLRVTRPDGHTDEFYLAGGLTIGRTEANTVALPDDDTVDQIHARVEVADDGCARLCCVDPDISLTVDGEAVRELHLDQDVRFRIGQTEFQCVSGQRSAERPDLAVRSDCPICTSKAVASAGEGIRQYPACKEPIIAIRPDSSSQEPLVLEPTSVAARIDSKAPRGEQDHPALGATLIIIASILGGACVSYAGRIATARIWDESQASITAKWCFASYVGASLLLSVLWYLSRSSEGEMGTRKVARAARISRLLLPPRLSVCVRRELRRADRRRVGGNLHRAIRRHLARYSRGDEREGMRDRRGCRRGIPLVSTP